ncbi:putative Mannose-sensitive agglutinin (MSHA) biogenesis protein MshG (pilus type IV) [Herminiimonas arsenicoxydans]|uniref:Mannose-sensitive agglutinin (MSHA) biogenesis protein MshG (Pilus type IV) n=1 Tax=Herminiimonas arsenicoxydans TaxID=204773 RepID=A4G6G4_HERAR|nr:putative Mannose-sensitive agglutinin (MSHA) biogenesis protein MshG (pilus type IV) [Herminiimonas arsenicoxydans]
MPFFAYKARNARGEMLQGVLEGIDSGSVADQLFTTGVTPVEIVATTRPAGSDGNDWWSKLTAPKIRSIDVQLFSRQLYTLLKAGVPIMRGLAGLQESAINKSFGLVVKDLRESLDAGRELSAAMRRHPKVFSPFYTNMVRVGEMTGRLEEVFLRLFDYLEFDRDMRQRIRTALRYPIFVVSALTVAMIVINLFVIPTFAKVYAGFKAELPFMTKLLIGTSNFMVQYWYLLLALVLGAAVAFKMYVETTNGRYQWDKFKLRIPIAGKIMLKGTLARFARSFALSSKSGVPIVQGLNVVAQTVGNTYIASRIEQMRDGVERGESILRTAVTTGVFTPVVLQMIAIGEETGELDSLMDEIAAMYEREVDYELKTLSAQIEPILIIGLGILVVVLALGVFLPIWDLGRAALGR